MLTDFHISNYKSLADVALVLSPVNVFFGPNGAGKSSILDALWFMRGCATQGVEETSAERDQGLGLLYAGAAPGANISLAISTWAASYEIVLGLQSGRINPMPGELLISESRGLELISRKVGSDKVEFHSTTMGRPTPVPFLREPEKISLPRFLDYDPASTEANDINNTLRYTCFYHSRSFKLYQLRKFGSESGHEYTLRNLGDNLWSVLRNLQGRRAVDDRYDTIIKFMVRSFPGFRDLVLDAPGPAVVYGSFAEAGLPEPIRAAGVSDGHLQMLLVLTALFSEGQRPGLLLFDEPDLSLHPWALAVLAEAIEDAARNWSKQVLLTTHSPVLMSQFDASRIIAVSRDDKGTSLRRLSEMEEIQDMLNRYTPGSLYMADYVGAQGPSAGPRGE